MKFSTSAIFSSVTSIARAGRRPDVDFERAGVDLGKELAPQDRREDDQHDQQQAEADDDRRAAVLQHPVEHDTYLAITRSIIVRRVRSARDEPRRTRS